MAETPVYIHTLKDGLVTAEHPEPVERWAEGTVESMMAIIEALYGKMLTSGSENHEVLIELLDRTFNHLSQTRVWMSETEMETDILPKRYLPGLNIQMYFPEVQSRFPDLPCFTELSMWGDDLQRPGADFVHAVNLRHEQRHNGFSGSPADIACQTSVLIYPDKTIHVRHGGYGGMERFSTRNEADKTFALSNQVDIRNLGIGHNLFTQLLYWKDIYRKMCNL